MKDSIEKALKDIFDNNPNKKIWALSFELAYRPTRHLQLRTLTMIRTHAISIATDVMTMRNYVVLDSKEIGLKWHLPLPYIKTVETAENHSSMKIIKKSGDFVLITNSTVKAFQLLQQTMITSNLLGLRRSPMATVFLTHLYHIFKNRLNE